MPIRQMLAADSHCRPATIYFSWWREMILVRCITLSTWLLCVIGIAYYGTVSNIAYWVIFYTL